MSTSEPASWPRLQRRGLKGLLLLSLLLSPLSAHAALKSWSAAVDGSWDDPAKWSPAGVPAPTDSVRIAAAGTYTVTLQGSVIVAQLSVGGNGGNPTLWVQGSSAKGNAALRVNGGGTNAGVIRLESTGGATTANLTLPSGTLTNQGTIEINAGTGGQRQLSADLDNQGTFRINAAALLNKVGGVYTNQGELRVQAGQSLTITGSNQVLNQNNGTLVVDGDLLLTSVTFNFNGGSIPNKAPQMLTSTLNIGAGATGTASFKLRGRSTMTGNIAAGQTIWANGTTRTDAVLTWNSGLTNAGTIRLESSEAVAASNLVLPSGTLTNTGLILVGQGSGGGRSLITNLDNRGTFTVGTTTRLTQTADGIFNNRGAITLTPTDTLDVAVGTFTNRAGGTLTGGGLLMLDRSTLAGTGTIGGNVEAWESTISPGSPVGILRIEGSYYQDAFSEVNIDLGGATPGTGYDRLEVTGEAYFDGGSLNVSLINGYQPGTCDQFNVVGYGSWQQLFQVIDQPTLSGSLQLRSVYDTDGLKLRVSDGDTRINIVPAELNLAEGGGSQSYRVCLGQRPESQVRIAVSPDAQVSVSPTELIFAQAAWTATQSVAATAVDDALAEGPHSGFISHSASSQDNDFDRTEVSRVVARIEDNETVPALSVNDVSVAEGNSGTKSLTFTVTLSAASTQTVTVAYATANGTATAGTDYVAANSTLSFSAGQTSKTFAVTINGDVVPEPDETFLVNLSNPTNATLADGQGQGTITNDDAQATLSINDVSVAEGNSETRNLTFTVSLSAASSQTVTVAYATANGTATAGSDYVAANGTLSFTPGQTSKSAVVTINGDLATEPDETLFVNLSNPTNATLADAQGQGTITNDDATPSLAVNDAAIAEGNSGTKTLNLTVSLSNPSSQAITVAYATANGTASAGSDYVAANGTLSFAAGETSKTVAVTINGDVLNEANETFAVNLSAPTNATIGDGQGTGTITNDDDRPSLSVNDVSGAEGNSGTSTLSFTVSLSAASGQTVTVAYATANGTANAGSDYVAASGTLSFAAGETSKTVAVAINGDLTSEANETFTLNLSSPVNAILADGQGLGTITNDDAQATLSINDVSVAEGNSETRNLTFTVSLSAASTQTITVAWATANGTATAGSDYNAANGTLSFSAGQTSKTVSVAIRGDRTVEPDETFFVNLSNANNATIADGQGIGTIANDDGGSSLTINDVSVSEGNSGTKNMTFTVTLSAASTQAITVAWATANGTATAGSDYVAASGTLNFSAGQTSKTVAVTINGDGADEPDETLVVNLSNANNATIADAQGQGTITNDDGQPGISINDATAAEGNSGTKSLIFTVSLSAASGRAVNVTYTTANGTASAGSDYVSASSNLVFTPGQTSKTVEITINGDLITEPDETFFVNLSSPTNVTIADGQGLGTITNDDAVPSLSINDVSVAEGNSGTKNLTFTVSLSAASGQTVTATYATANGTATAGTDYVVANGTLTFAAGETSKTIAVTINGDALTEPDETFVVDLTSPTNATLADAQGQGTITNDDAAPSLSVNDVSVAEGNSGTKPLTFTVVLANPSSQVVTVAYATANGTATAGSDYVATSGTLSFAAGETSKTVAITINGDVLNETNETFTLTLSAPVNATLTDALGAGTITNDDARPSLAVGDVAATEGNSGTKNLTFTVSLSAASGQAVSVTYATANGTASAGSDYVAANGILNFSAGDTSLEVTIAVNGDGLNEADETFILNLSNATNATIADAQGLGGISNDDPVPSLAVNDASVAEGNSGTKTLSFAVSLSAASGQAVSVAYVTANGTATSGTDYTAASGTLTFAAGEISKTIAVTISGDVLAEDDETFALNLSVPTNATLADAQGLGTLTNDDLDPTVSISDASVSEGNSGTKTLSFTVTLSTALGRAANVTYTTANGTATAGSDYAADSRNLVFTPDVTSQTVEITINGDLLNEADETFTVTLGSPTHVVIADGLGIGTITNDDAVPNLAVNDVTVAEGNTGTSTLTFAVTLSTVSGQAVSVAYATANGTATAGSDYTAASGTLTFAAGETSKTVAVTVAGDGLNEANETFTFNLSAPTNAAIADAQGIGTITNDDPVPGLAVNDVTAVEGNTGTSTLSFAVTLSPVSGQTVTVAYATANGTATAGSDYTAANGTLSFAPGETSKTVAVTVNGDVTTELDETLTINLSAPANATISDAQGVGTITNDDAPPTIAVNEVSVVEGNTGTSAVSFTVTLSNPSSSAITVAYATANGTATAGSDYTAASGTLSFAAGEVSKTVAVVLNGDALNEADETFTLNLSAPTNATIADAQGIGTLTNDDPVPGLLVNEVVVAEGNTGTGALTFTVTLSAASGQAVSVAYATANGTATAGTDYTAASGTLGFAVGEVSKTVTVTVAGDLTTEPDETLTLNLSAPINATVANAQGVGTITNDDAPPRIAVNDVAATEGNTGTSTLSFAVTLSNPSSSAITVQYVTANGTATAGSDYTAANGTLTFAAGETSKTVLVTITGDALNEANETFTLNLSAPTNATIGDAQGIGTLTNDDPVPSLVVNDVSVNEGNTGTSSLSFTVSLSAASGQTVTVAYTSANGSATAGSDYTATTGTLTFDAGEASKTVAVAITGDLTTEPDENLTLNLSAPVNATVADAQGIGTITNDDAPPSIAVSDVSAAEGNTGTSTLSFAVTLSNPSSAAITVVYATTNGTATVATSTTGVGGDYLAASGTLSFAAGETSKVVVVTINGDVLNEADEAFNLNLSAPTNATIGDAQGIGTITNDDPVPSLVVNDLAANEGNTGTSTLSFTVILSAASGQTVTVAYATANGTAISGSDYTATSGTLTFLPGDLTETVAVTVNGDLTTEPDETLTLNLSAPGNATVADAQGVGTITNDDATPTIGVNDVSAAEGNSGTSTLNLTVTLSNPSSAAITVTYATANGTAATGSDYTAASGTLSFAAGETSKTVAVTIAGDVNNEVNETFTLNLSAPTNATIADAQGIGTVTNDDATPTLAVSDASGAEGNTGTSTLNFTVTLSAASGQTVTVAYVTANGTATAGTDYTAATGTLTFAPGDLTEVATVTVSGDLVTEPSETFSLNLSTPTNATISDAQGIGTITNDDAAPTIAVNNAAVTEGNSGTGTLSFTVTLSNPSSSAITVQYVTANLTATVGSDYTVATGILTFAAGETSKTVAVTVTGDLVTEPNETFTLNLSGAANATISDAQGIGTITNDDASPTIAVNNVSVTEGNSGTVPLTFTVLLSNASSSAITVGYATANGTATAGTDYTAASGTLSFAAGETSKTVTVNGTGDDLYEENETVLLNLSSPTNATLGDSQGIGTLTNDDAAPTLTVDDAILTEGNSGTSTMTFIIRLSAVSGMAANVNYTTTDGTAASGSDYVADTHNVVLNPGETTLAVAVTINGDQLNEADETFTLALSTPNNATIADGVGTGTITNDDAQPNLTVNNVTANEGNSGTTSFTFTATLSAVSGQTVTVVYATANGTATAGADYTAASGTLTFLPGDLSETVVVAVTGETTFEPSETFTLNLSSATNAGITDNQGTGTITNDDTSPTIAVNNVTVDEGNSGTKTLSFTISLSNASSSTITVQYATANVTAISASDYTATNGTLTFAAGETSKTVAVSVIGDTRNEANETLNLNLTNATNSTIADAQGVGTITNDDPQPSLSVNDVAVTEGNSGTKLLTFTVRLSTASNLTVTVAYATANETATAGSDYVAKSGTLTFVAADTVETVAVTINGDGTAEATETFNLNLSSASNATISDATGIGTITNDDGIAKVVADGLIGEGRFGVANYPNPFNPSTQIVYTLTEEGPVRLVIYDVLGQRVRVLVEGLQAPGSYEVQWDGRDEAGQQAGAGWYLYRLEAGTQVATGRMSLVK